MWMHLNKIRIHRLRSNWFLRLFRSFSVNLKCKNGKITIFSVFCWFFLNYFRNKVPLKLENKSYSLQKIWVLIIVFRKKCEKNGKNIVFCWFFRNYSRNKFSLKLENTSYSLQKTWVLIIVFRKKAKKWWNHGFLHFFYRFLLFFWKFFSK